LDDQPQIQPAEILAGILSAGNLADMLPEEKLAAIAGDVCADYQTDLESMQDWKDKMKRGIDLAKLVKEDKSYPWENAANVKYPLITTAALQFNARAYPAIVPSEDVVRVKVWGVDKTGQKARRGERVASFMSWQLTCQMTEWEEETDKLLVMLPIVGTVIRKVWHDQVQNRPRCRVIAPGAFVVNDAVKCIDDAPRCTEELPLFPSEIETRIRSGMFRKEVYADGEESERQVSQLFLEQHCRIDLDEDGYPEPYIVTVHHKMQKVARIVPDFGQEDVRLDQAGNVVEIKRGSYFVPYHFLPSMDGGFFGTGLGLLLGDVSDSINSIINMLLDAGHMAALGGGFIGSEFRIKGGNNRMRPGEWKQVNARGSDVKSAIVPLTFPGPDATLFQLLGLLIDAGKEVASVKDVLTGDTGGRSMTATTTLALIEQGMQVFTAAYKRIFRALKAEYRMVGRINTYSVSPEEYSLFHDEMDPNGQVMMLDPRQDFGAADMDIVPVADPRSVTKMQEAAKAELLMQMAGQGMVDPAVAAQRALEAASIGNVEELMPKPNPMQEAMGQMAMQGAQAELGLKMVGIDKAMAEIEEIRSTTIKNLTDADTSDRAQRLDEMMAKLEVLREGLGLALASGLGAMAGTPRQPINPIGPVPVMPAPAQIGGNGVLGGQPMAGFGAPGPAAPGGFA